MKDHPSGRPIPKDNRRDYSMRADRFIGFRCPRLNPQHIEQATDTHAIGFVDWRIVQGGADLDMKRRR